VKLLATRITKSCKTTKEICVLRTTQAPPDKPYSLTPPKCINKATSEQDTLLVVIIGPRTVTPVNLTKRAKLVPGDAFKKSVLCIIPYFTTKTVILVNPGKDFAKELWRGKYLISRHHR
jgi:hypothetical protein